MDRTEYAALIAARLRPQLERLRKDFMQGGGIRTAVMDDLLPAATAREIYAAFPGDAHMMLRNSIREKKYVTAQMDRHAGILEEIIYAFQAPPVVRLLSDMTGLQTLFPDDHLYAGGLSVMARGHYLHPHLDNSHDMERRHYRVLNLLYYVTPEWHEEYGGNLELWDRGPGKGCRTVASKFNRLVIMGTGEASWHSVSPVSHDGRRCCVSNYYFSPASPDGRDYFHATSFRARPGHPFLDLLLRADAFARNALRVLFKKGVVPTRHVYRR